MTVVSEAVVFLDRIGLGVDVVESVPAGSFMPMVAISRGRLLVMPACPVSDLLHEAGHLVCVPARFRTWMDGNLATGQRRMFRALEASGIEPDAPLMRAAIQCSDPEATAWAWAAGKHLGFAEADIIRDQDYEGEGRHIRKCLALGAYFGINGLMAAGMCDHPRRGGYPLMVKWVQDAS